MKTRLLLLTFASLICLGLCPAVRAEIGMRLPEISDRDENQIDNDLNDSPEVIAVPEPGTWAAGALGLAAVAYALHRRFRKKLEAAA
jgi:hypothetical protein